MQKPERPPFDSWDYYLAKAVCMVRRFDFPARCARTNKDADFLLDVLDRTFSIV